jgi:hypothetical protein
VIAGFEEVLRINRPYPWDFAYGLIARALPEAMNQKILDSNGVVLMQRSAGASG